jgi:hypothetical protein
VRDARPRGSPRHRPAASATANRRRRRRSSRMTSRRTSLLRSCATANDTEPRRTGLGGAGNAHGVSRVPPPRRARRAFAVKNARARACFAVKS